MTTIKRGYQGNHRFILEDLENEFTRRLTTDEVQVGFLLIELLALGHELEICKKCKWRGKEKE
jgi:hypothetical protein